MEPIPPDFLQPLMTLGIGGVLAAFMFHFYRKDSLKCQEHMREDREAWQAQTELLVRVIQENTTSNTKLCTLIDVLGRSGVIDRRRGTVTGDES